MTQSKWKRNSGLAAAVLSIVSAVFVMEGGYVNDPRDPGGETNHGITVAVARDHGYTGAMKELTQEQASEIYITSYIEKPNYVEIISLSPAVGQKLVDAGVNAGTTRSSRWFQTALNSLSRGGVDYPNVTVDGRIGTGTITSYKGLQNKRGRVKACELVIKLMERYPSIITAGGMLLGWIAGGMLVTDPAFANPDKWMWVPKLPQTDTLRYAASIAGALLVLVVGKWMASRRPPAAASAEHG